jgi:predicted nucleic acid-binding protein
VSLTYLDTSALVRLLMQEGDILPVEEAMRAGTVSSRLVRIEVYSAIFRRWRSGDIAHDDRDRLLDVVEGAVLSAVTLLPLNGAVLNEAEEIVRGHAVRTLDALHLATAAVAARYTRRHGTALAFCTGDRRQADAAVALFGTTSVILVPPLA